MKPATGEKQTGATLLEALIGILIFSLGILALVGMQALAIKQTTEAKYRVDASFFANQIIGEMWVNRTNLASFAYPGGTAAPLAPWVAAINADLPEAAAYPPQILVAGNTVTVTIRWRPPGSATPNNYLTIAYINCC